VLIKSNNHVFWNLKGGNSVSDVEPMEIVIGLTRILVIGEALTISVSLVVVNEEAGRLGAVVDSHGRVLVVVADGTSELFTVDLSRSIAQAISIHDSLDIATDLHRRDLVIECWESWDINVVEITLS
jgi:hypothetical protein